MGRYTNGWVKLHRSIGEGDIKDNSTLLALWAWLLVNATWQETKILWEGNKRILPAGSILFGMKELALKWNCSRATIHKWVHYLASSNRITLEVSTRGCLATICKWDEYQSFEDDERTTSEPQLNHERTTSEPQVALNEENKKGRSEELNKSARSRSRLPDLELAYQNYPLKVGKARGLKKLTGQIKTQEDYDLLLKAIAHYSASKRVREGFIKNFDTFAGEWRDWTDASAGSSQIHPVRSPTDLAKIKALEAEEREMKRLTALRQEESDLKFEAAIARINAKHAKEAGHV